MDEKIVATVQKTIGDTLYITEYAVSDHARETAYEKLKRLILSDIESLENRQAS